MGRPLYTNNAATYLAFGITNTATTMQVSANTGHLFPSPVGGDYFYVSLISLSGPIIEIVKCTARSGDIFTIERGQEGTSPLYWNMGDNVQLRITAAGMNFIAGSAVQTTEEQSFIATQGQTVFTLTSFDYAPGTNNLAVFVNGSKQVYGINYSETSVNTVTFNFGLNAGDVVEFLVGASIASGTLYATDIKYTPGPNSLLPSGTVETALNNLSDKTVGANYVGYNQGASGSANITVTAKLQETVSVLDFGADPTGSTDSATAIQNAINAASTTSGIVTLPAGTFLINTAISLIGKYVTIIGAGQTHTIIKANATLTSVFEIGETTDNTVAPFVIQDLQINGNNTTTNGINVRYRHQSVVRNVYIINCTYGMQEKDTWINYRENVRCDSCSVGFYLVGSNHNSHWNRCTTTGFSNTGIFVDSQGTALDGNLALLFSACDVEYGDGYGIQFNGTSATFDTCYLGENVGKTIFTLNNGNILIQGGFFLYGYTTSSRGFDVNAGKIQYQSGLISNQGALGVGGMVRGTGTGKIKFFDNAEAQGFGGTIAITGDFLDYGPAATVFASRYGKNYTVASFNANATVTSSTPSNPIGKTLTVSAANSSTPRVVEFSIPLINTTEWQPNGPLYFVVVYSSNAAFSAQLSNGAFGTTPTRSLGALPSTSGTISTYIKLDQTFDTNAYTTLEIFNDAPATGNTFTLYEVYLADQAMMATGDGNLSNLYKC